MCHMINHMRQLGKETGSEFGEGGGDGTPPEPPSYSTSSCQDASLARILHGFANYLGQTFQNNPRADYFLDWAGFLDLHEQKT